MVTPYLFILCITFTSVLAQSMPLTIDALDALLKELIKTINQMMALLNRWFAEICTKNGGPVDTDEYEKALQEFNSCIDDLRQFEIVSPNNTSDEVFKGFCLAKPIFKSCIRKLADVFMLCLSFEEKQNMKIFHNITEQMLDFICHEEGHRITSFLAENGPACYDSKKEEIQTCADSSFRELQRTTNTHTNIGHTLLNIHFIQKECSQLTSLQKCTVKSLESCRAPTIVNMVDQHLFQIIREVTPCSKFDNNSTNVYYYIIFAITLLAVVSLAFIGKSACRCR